MNSTSYRQLVLEDDDDDDFLTLLTLLTITLEDVYYQRKYGMVFRV